MASGAITPAPPPIPVQPIVRTRKKVPMNSAMYLFTSRCGTPKRLVLASAIDYRTIVVWVLADGAKRRPVRRSLDERRTPTPNVDTREPPAELYAGGKKSTMEVCSTGG